MKIKIGTRGSKLAVAQSTYVMHEIMKLDATIECELVVIKTKGDQIQDVSLDKIGDKGIFVKEIEEQLISGEIDMAVHSMKDMPVDSREELKLIPVLKREDPRDALITLHEVKEVKDLPNSATIGTGSKRRGYHLKTMLPSVQIQAIRGNVDSRIDKMLRIKLDGIVLAMAGLNRLKIESTSTYCVVPIAIEDMIPAPTQGILGLQLRADRVQLFNLVCLLMDEETLCQAEAERVFMKEVNGGCHAPMGAYLEILDKKRVRMHGVFGNETHVFSGAKEGMRQDAGQLAQQVAQGILLQLDEIKSQSELDEVKK